VGFFARSNTVATVGTAITARISAGMIVQLISSALLPCDCTGSRVSPFFTRKRNAT